MKTFTKQFPNLLQSGVLFIALCCNCSLVQAEAGAPPSSPPPSFGISPNRVVVDLSHQPKSGSAKIINMGSRDIRIETQVANWDLDESNKFRELPVAPGTLPAAMILNPVSFDLAQGSSQTVRFMIMPGQLEGVGEHRAMLFFSETVATDNPGIQLRFRLGMPIYARVGEADFSLTLHDVELRREQKSAALKFDISALGTAHVRPTGHYLVWHEKDFPGERKALRSAKRMAQDHSRQSPKHTLGGRVTPKPVFPGTRREVSVPVALPETPGNYLLAVHLASAEQEFSQILKVTL